LVRSGSGIAIVRPLLELPLLYSLVPSGIDRRVALDSTNGSHGSCIATLAYCVANAAIPIGHNCICAASRNAPPEPPSFFLPPGIRGAGFFSNGLIYLRCCSIKPHPAASIKRTNTHAGFMTSGTSPELSKATSMLDFISGVDCSGKSTRYQP